MRAGIGVSLIALAAACAATENASTDLRPVTLPDLSQPQFFQPLSITNFVFPYPAMDMPTPQPAHTDPAPVVAPDYRARVLGAPAPAVSGPPVDIRPDAGPSGLRGTVEVRNAGTGILVWSASTSANWIVVDPPAGVALGSDVACSAPTGCRPASAVTISANPVLLPQSAASGTVTITGSNATGSPATVTVNVVADFDSGASGTSRAY